MNKQINNSKINNRKIQITVPLDTTVNCSKWFQSIDKRGVSSSSQANIIEHK